MHSGLVHKRVSKGLEATPRSRAFVDHDLPPSAASSTLPQSACGARDKPLPGTRGSTLPIVGASAYCRDLSTTAARSICEILEGSQSSAAANSPAPAIRDFFGFQIGAMKSKASLPSCLRRCSIRRRTTVGDSAGRGMYRGCERRDLALSPSFFLGCGAYAVPSLGGRRASACWTRGAAAGLIRDANSSARRALAGDYR